jgi:hypothetical protein
MKFFAFVRYWRKNGSTMRQYISYSYTSRKTVIQLGREILYSIFFEFRVGMKTCNEVHIGKYLYYTFPIHNGLELGDALSPLLFNFVLEYSIREVQKTRWD